MSWEREQKGHAIGWANEVIYAWEGAPWVHDGDVRHQGGTHLTCLAMDDKDMSSIWERMGQLGRHPRREIACHWQHEALKRFDDPIDTPTKMSHRSIQRNT